MENLNEEIEIWADVVTHVGLYQISTFGNVKSLDREVPWSKSSKIVYGKMLKPDTNIDGYKVILLSYNGEQKKMRVHQLVAMAFMGYTMTNPKLTIHHIDEVKDNNRLTNLKIVTLRENVTLYHKTQNHSSNYTGVNKNRSGKGWSCSIIIDGKRVYLGRYDNEEDAGIVYESALSSYNNGDFDSFIPNINDEINQKRLNRKTSKYIGVSQGKGVRWSCRLNIKGQKPILLGTYDTEYEAHLMVEAARCNYIESLNSKPNQNDAA